MMENEGKERERKEENGIEEGERGRKEEKQERKRKNEAVREGENEAI